MAWIPTYTFSSNVVSAKRAWWDHFNALWPSWAQHPTCVCHSRKEWPESSAVSDPAVRAFPFVAQCPDTAPTSTRVMHLSWTWWRMQILLDFVFFNDMPGHSKAHAAKAAMVFPNSKTWGSLNKSALTNPPLTFGVVRNSCWTKYSWLRLADRFTFKAPWLWLTTFLVTTGVQSNENWNNTGKAGKACSSSTAFSFNTSFNASTNERTWEASTVEWAWLHEENAWSLTSAQPGSTVIPGPSRVLKPQPNQTTICLLSGHAKQVVFPTMRQDGPHEPSNAWKKKSLENFTPTSSCYTFGPTHTQTATTILCPGASPALRSPSICSYLYNDIFKPHLRSRLWNPALPWCRSHELPRFPHVPFQRNITAVHASQLSCWHQNVLFENKQVCGSSLSIPAFNAPCSSSPYWPNSPSKRILEVLVTGANHTTLLQKHTESETPAMKKKTRSLPCHCSTSSHSFLKHHSVGSVFTISSTE